MTQQPQTDHALERLVFFSDAVFAIAITLLVIEIHVPHLPRNAADSDFLWALARLLPNFIGYVVSFAVIGAFWAGHHRSFMLARHYSWKIVPWNLALLGAIGFMPFTTAFVSAHGGLRVPTVTYCVWMLITGLLSMRVVTIVTAPPMAEAADPAAVMEARSRSLAVVLGAATAVVVGFVFPWVGQSALITIPLWKALLVRRAKARGRA
jgi:uncharacterized membrane protein